MGVAIDTWDPQNRRMGPLLVVVKLFPQENNTPPFFAGHLLKGPIAIPHYTNVARKYRKYDRSYEAEGLMKNPLVS